MMSGHGENPVFFNKKKVGHPEHSLTLHRPTSNNISFLPHPTPTPLKMDVICVSPLKKGQVFSLLPTI